MLKKLWLKFISTPIEDIVLALLPGIYVLGTAGVIIFFIRPLPFEEHQRIVVEFILLLIFCIWYKLGTIKTK